MSEHVYFRTIDPDGHDSLAEIVRRLSPGETVLDVGCGVGALGLYLKQAKNCIVDGIDLEQSQSPEAQAAYRHLVQGNLEQVDLTTIFAPQRYNAIILADVLEHLRHPVQILLAAKELLEPTGRIYLVLPNVTYIGILAELCRGRFSYREKGLLDHTHIRFFDHQAALNLVAEAGLTVADLQRLSSDPMDTEFGAAWLDQLPGAVRRYFLAQEEALTYQFLLEVRLAPALAPPPLTRASKPPLCYGMQFFWGDKDHQFSEKASNIQKALMEVERQTISVPIPVNIPATLPNTPLGAIRWDPADRPGALDIFMVQIRDPAGVLLWELTDFGTALASANNIILLKAGDGIVGNATPWRILLTNDDPSLCLPIPAELLSQLPANSQLAVTVSWPRSGDWLELAKNHTDLEQKLAKSNQEIALLIQEKEKLASLAHVHTRSWPTLFKLRRLLRQWIK